MNNSEQEKMLDLLIAKATTGLSTEEENQLRELEEVFPEFKDDLTFEFTAATIGLVDLKAEEPLPAHLQSKILADADKYFAPETNETPNPAASTAETEEEYQKTFAFEPKSSIWQSLGWLVAAFACVALAVNLWMTRTGTPSETAQNPPAQITPTPTPSLAQQRQMLLASANDVVQKSWTDIDPEQPRDVQGDIVWSNSQQKGYLRFRNLPINDKTKEAYQLWIFDDTQKHPIDGGVFNADQSGEIIIPIDPKLKVEKPTMFAVTAEKPGGVVVSAQEKVMAIAKV